MDLNRSIDNELNALKDDIIRESALSDAGNAFHDTFPAYTHSSY